MLNYYSFAVLRLIDILFSAYLFIVLLRILLDAHRASYYNPICQMAIRLTDFAVKPLRRITPSLRMLDCAAILFWCVLILVYCTLLPRMESGSWPTWSGVFVFSAAKLLDNLQSFYLWAIILQALLSWAPSLQRSPLMDVLLIVTEPLLKRARRLMPVFAGGLDLSPLLILFLLYAFGMLIITPLYRWAGLLLTHGH